MSDLQQIDSVLEEILSSNFRIDTDEYDDSTSLGSEGLDLDSLDVLELTELLEMKLNVSISDEELEDVDTVRDLKAELGR